MTTEPGWFVRRMWWQPPRRHPSADSLLALALGTTDTARTDVEAASHVQTCGPCEHRFKTLTTELAAMPAVANDGFEQVFTPERLQAQRARIGHRLEQLVGMVEPARVLAFPVSGQTLRQFDSRPVRWLAVAAVAGVLLGVSVGQLIPYHPFVAPTTTATDSANTTAPVAALDETAGTFDMTGTIELPPSENDAPTQASPLSLVEFAALVAEEGFLTNLDLALTSHRISELASLDALTPRVRDRAIDNR